jgi:myo-inositol-1(or 4)-monophosphatase
MPTAMITSPHLGLERELAVACRLACEAGAALIRHRRSGAVARPSRRGLVTTADLIADTIIRDGLAEAFPSDAFRSEHAADSAGRLEQPRVWIVDPLDSKTNYIQGGDEFSVSIGLAVDGQATLGAVYNPARDELVAGALSRGVRFNGRPARASRAAQLHSARLTIGRKCWQRNPDGVGRGLAVIPVASMAYKLARVAAGMDDGVVSVKRRSEWGTCAGVALVHAAGGHATLLDGSPITFSRAEHEQPLGMLAAGPELHPLLLARLRHQQPI